MNPSLAAALAAARPLELERAAGCCTPVAEHRHAGRSQMAQAFFERRSAGEIRACADAVLARHDDVPIRSHVMTLGERETRECLRADTCDAVATTR